MLSPTRAGLLILALATPSLAACDATGGSGPLTPTPLSLRADSISLRWWAGECLGYCQGTTEIGPTLQGTYTEAPWRPEATYPPTVESFTIAAVDWQNIQSVARTALGESWQASYGCPDCGDWGGWDLTIQTGAGETRTTTLDNRRSKKPPALESLLEAVQALTPGKPLKPVTE